MNAGHATQRDLALREPSAMGPAQLTVRNLSRLYLPSRLRVAIRQCCGLLMRQTPIRLPKFLRTVLHELECARQ